MTAEIAPIDAESVASVLSEVAEIASETLELQQVFGRVANAVRRVIPFDNMGVCRIVDGDHMVLHAAEITLELLRSAGRRSVPACIPGRLCGVAAR